MGIVLEFPRRHRHVRAPSRIAAKVSKVICLQRFALASRTKAGQRWAGMPRSRQPLTVEGARSSSSETALVPPRASIAASGVSMDASIVRDPRTSQVFAKCETTKAVCRDEMPVMAGSVSEIARRPATFAWCEFFA